jgi:ABC-2 type transport system permease protein
LTSPAPETEAFYPSPCRIYGLILRHVYLYRGSWPRLVEMMYWPVLNISLYGFVSLSIVHHFGHADVMTNAYLAGLMLMEIMTRAVMGMLVMYMEEVWSRNLGHLFASPLRLRDYVAGLITLCTARCLLSVIPAFIIVYFLFDFSILQLGWNLPVYAALLCLNGWWYGLMVVSLLLRFGWMSTWLLLPFVAAYYPVEILPKAFQFIAWKLPGTYVFESMKAQLATGSARPDYLWMALGLNMIYFMAAGFIFNRAFRSARRSGGLLQMGE